MLAIKKVKATVLWLTVCFSLIALVNAEPSWVTWSQTYGGINDDGAFHLVYLVETPNGEFAWAGNTKSFGAGNSDFWLVKTDSTGNTQWNQTYGGTEFDVPYAFVQTSDEGFALAGLTESYGVGNSDFWLVKTDLNGNIQWNKTYGGTQSDIAYSVIETADGDFALAVYTMSFGAGDADFWLVKTDDNGNMEWNATYGGTKGDIATALIETSNGGYAVVRYSRSYSDENSDFLLIKTDKFGNMEWNQTFGGENYDYASTLVETADGGYALAGYTHSFGAGDADFWLIKTDATGNMKWSKTYGDSHADLAH